MKISKLKLSVLLILTIILMFVLLFADVVQNNSFLSDAAMLIFFISIVMLITIMRTDLLTVILIISVMLSPVELLKGNAFVSMVISVILLTSLVMLIIRFFGRNKDKSVKNKVDGVADTGEILKKKHSLLKKLLIAFLAITLVSILGITLEYLNPTNSDGESPEPVDSSVWNDTDKANFKNALVNECGSDRAELCTCIADYLIETQTPDEVFELLNQFDESESTVTIPRAFAEASATCK